MTFEERRRKLLEASDKYMRGEETVEGLEQAERRYAINDRDDLLALTEARTRSARLSTEPPPDVE